MKNLKFVVYREDKYYVSQCLNVDVSSFGNTIDEAIRNLREAVELCFERGEWVFDVFIRCFPAYDYHE